MKTTPAGSSLPLKIIAQASKIPNYEPEAIARLMEKLDMNERAFSLIMNVSPITVRLWTAGAAIPSGTAKRLMQLFESCPELLDKIMVPESKEHETQAN